jgi:serine/threonine protein kinase
LAATFESSNHLNFLLDFCPGGELFFHLQRVRFDEKEAKFFFVEIIMCLEYLHREKILYRDLKVKIKRKYLKKKNEIKNIYLNKINQKNLNLLN